MKPYERPIFVVDGVDRLLCPFPLKINVYRGCQGRCAYCSMNAQHARWRSRAKGDISEVAPSPIKYIEKIFYRSTGMERQLIDQRYPVQIGHASDPCQPLENRFRILEKTLRILKDFNYPVILTTKWPNLLTEDPYLNLLSELPVAVQCSISSEDQYMLSKLEPEAPSMRRRFAALKTLHDAGCHVQLRLWPYIPNTVGNIYELFRLAKESGIDIVLANFLKIYNAGKSSICSVIDTTDYIQIKNAKVLNPSMQREYIFLLEDICHEFGLKLVNADDYHKTWQDCCGLSGYGFKPAPWAYPVRGHVIKDHTTYEEYMHGLDCPYHEDFKLKYEGGGLTGVYRDLIFNEDKTYTRLNYGMS
jgi:DNA repair photolyase